MRKDQHDALDAVIPRSSSRPTLGDDARRRLAEAVNQLVALTDAPIDHEGPRPAHRAARRKQRRAARAIVADYLPQSNATRAPAARPNPAIVKALAAVA